MRGFRVLISPGLSAKFECIALKLSNQKGTKVPKFITAEALSQDIAKLGLTVSPERILELADLGYMPHVRVDGKDVLFAVAASKQWVLDNLVSRNGGREFPKSLAIFDLGENAHSQPVPLELLPISRNLLEFPAALLQIPCGIYFLIKNGVIIYVGQTAGLAKRLTMHSGGWEKKDFDRVLYLPVPKEDLNEVELLFTRKFRPQHNTRILRPSDESQYAAMLGRYSLDTPCGNDLDETLN